MHQGPGSRPSISWVLPPALVESGGGFGIHGQLSISVGASSKAIILSSLAALRKCDSSISPLARGVLVLLF